MSSSGTTLSSKDRFRFFLIPYPDRVKAQFLQTWLPIYASKLHLETLFVMLSMWRLKSKSPGRDLRVQIWIKNEYNSVSASGQILYN